MESSGIQRLSDRKTRKVIYEILKAQSIQDFKDRLKTLKFPSSDKGELVPSMGNFRRLHDAATVFAKRFLRAVSVMSKRAKASDLLPLRGKGKHGEGMVEIFLKTWPKDCGNSLYSHCKQSSTELDACGTLEAFLQKFLKQLRAYKELKQKSDDLNSILHFSTKPQQDNKTSGAGISQDRRFESRFNNNSSKQPFHQKVHAMQEENTEVRDELEVEEVEQVTEELDGNQDVTDDNAEDRQLMEEAQQMDEDISHLASFSGKPKTEQLPCFNMFNKGKCEVKGCLCSH